MMRRAVLVLVLVLAALAGACNAAAADLSPAEQRLVAAVQAESADALLLLERSVNINSGTMNAAGVREVGALFRRQLDQLGFHTRWIDMPAAMQRAGHLLATRDGGQGKRVLLLGHLDTVFEPDSPVQKWDRQGARVRGQGVNDMKGGDVALIQALRALARVGALEHSRLAVLLTGDEEHAGDPKSVSRRDMVELAKASDVALAFEGTVLGPGGRATGTVGRRATSEFTLDVKGRQAHSAGIFGAAGYGAVYEAARILDGFRQQVVEPGLTFNPGVILGGTDIGYDPAQSRGSAFGKTNVIANAVTVKGDLRYLDDAQRDRARARMRAIAAQSLPGTSASITFDDSYPPMAVTAGNLALLALYSQASADAGLGEIDALPAEARGAGDIQFAAPYVDSLDGLGASGRGAHSPGEELELASVERAAIRTALLLYRLTR
ncbi:MAG: M20/M25/M40 family metallo-hydrolase [Pseudomonadota bacterium]|nr:M20/M25/M40 family metallo-hydrolase [Pseudomonadota bacterium]